MPRSVPKLKKIGFRKEGHLRGYAKVGNQLQDYFLFAITAMDWKSRTAR